MDHFQDLRSEMILTMERLGVEVEVQHHEVGTAGQAEIDMRFDTLLAMADKLMLYKYVVKNVARQNGLSATFMPKPIFQDNGSGMHVHQSLWNGDEPLFFDEIGYAGLSDLARWYIGGLLAHAPAILAFAAPTTNSYKRLVPGYEAPVNLVYSQRNRSAAVRIPLYSTSPKAKRLEFRCPDPSCNPYLAFPAMLMAGLDGILNKTEPPDPVDKDLYDLPPEELKKVPQVPGSLDSRSPPSRPTASSSRQAACSPTTSSRRGSSTSGSTRSTPSACAPTRGSSTCTTTSEPLPARVYASATLPVTSCRVTPDSQRTRQVSLMIKPADGSEGVRALMSDQPSNAGLYLVSARCWWDPRDGAVPASGGARRRCLLRHREHPGGPVRHDHPQPDRCPSVLRPRAHARHARSLQRSDGLAAP